MITRREILHVGIATAALAAGDGALIRAVAQQSLSESSSFSGLMRSAISHCCMSLTSMASSSRSTFVSRRSISESAKRGQPPHLTGMDFLRRFGIPEKSASAYALTDLDFATLAKSYGRIGEIGWLRWSNACAADAATRRSFSSMVAIPGRDRSARTAAKARTWSIAWRCSSQAVTGHWEFTYGETRVKELIKTLDYPFLALNIRDTEWNEPAFEPMKLFEKGGLRIAVLGQAFPYTPVANPRWLMPKWSFGIREEDVRANVEKARKAGAQLVVLLSHNGFDVDRKLASRVPGIDVILTSHTHDALPKAIKVDTDCSWPRVATENLYLALTSMCRTAR